MVSNRVRGELQPIITLSQSLEHAIAGVLSVDTGSSTTLTLTTGDGPQAQADNQARQASLIFTGASANCVVTVPATQKIYNVHNTNASNTITLRLSGTTTDLVLQGKHNLYSFNNRS